MGLTDRFTDPGEDALAADFMANGYVVRDVDDRAALDAFRHEIVRLACEHLKCDPPADDGVFLNGIHERVSVAEINALRLHVFNGLNKHAWCRPTYLSLARKAIDALVGNELAMQNRVNLSIQMPNDETSALAVHADVWSAETPYEVVEWTPLVDVYDTKAMYILRPEINRTVRDRMSTLKDGGKEFDLFEAYRNEFHWIPVKYGQTLVFSPFLLHGNVRNDTPESRWSVNCRLTGLFTPYASDEKCLGRFYTPVTPKMTSRIGMNFKAPEGFNG